MCKVRGIGVALIDKTFMECLKFVKVSFCFTPKRCSSSIISKPKFLKITSLPKILCVPTKISISPFAVLSLISLTLLPSVKRLKSRIFTGNSAILSRKVFVCCAAKTVVGAKTAT
jgi:hypothetical protein